MVAEHWKTREKGLRAEIEALKSQIETLKGASGAPDLNEPARMLLKEASLTFEEAKDAAWRVFLNRSMTRPGLIQTARDLRSALGREI